MCGGCVMCNKNWEDVEHMKEFGNTIDESDMDDSIRLQDNYLIKGMHLIDGDIFVIKTKFNKEKMLFDNYSGLENLFVYVHGEYESIDWTKSEIFKGLRVDVLMNKSGHWRSCGYIVCNRDTTWGDIESEILDIFILNIGLLEQFNYRIGTSLEYVGNCGKYKFLEDRHLKLIHRWLLNKNNERIINGFEYYDHSLPICNLFMGDVYKYKDIQFTIESWRNDEREETQLYRALKNMGMREDDADLVCLFNDKAKGIKAVKIKYKKKHEEGYLTVNNDGVEFLQPILLGFNIRTMYDLFCGENHVADDVRKRFKEINAGKVKKATSKEGKDDFSFNFVQGSD